jgi:hypothetical protein
MSTMSNFLYHTSCPKCGSSDANGVYDDGHEWCWSCGKYTPAKIKSISQVESALNSNKPLKKGELPDDITSDIPKEPYQWLKQYALTSEEISNNRIGWSQRNSMLIIPYFGEDNDVLCWQGRFFPTRSPKVYTSGYPDDCILLHHNSDREFTRRVVVVEDAISAIKVSRVCTSSELLGSNLSRSKAIRLSKMFDHLTFWLDFDKYSSMIRQVEQNKILFKQVDFIVTKQDPKELTTEQIKEKLNES